MHKHCEEKHLDVHYLLPVERVWELGDFNSWTWLFWETISHLYKKEKHTFITLHSSDEILASTSQACLRTKETELEMGQKYFFSLSFPLHSEHLISIIITFTFLISSFTSYVWSILTLSTIQNLDFESWFSQDLLRHISTNPLISLSLTYVY